MDKALRRAMSFELPSASGNGPSHPETSRRASGNQCNLTEPGKGRRLGAIPLVQRRNRLRLAIPKWRSSMLRARGRLVRLCNSQMTDNDRSRSDTQLKARPSVVSKLIVDVDSVSHDSHQFPQRRLNDARFETVVNPYVAFWPNPDKKTCLTGYRCRTHSRRQPRRPDVHLFATVRRPLHYS